MHSKDRPGAKDRQSGQAAVETALVAPMMVFIILAIIQLGMMHNARLMTEYGAYRAVRSGIVNHGDCAIMRHAVLATLLPTLAPLPGDPEGATSHTLTKAVSLHNRYTDYLARRSFFYEDVGLELFRVEVLNPRSRDLAGLFSTYGSHMDGLEIDYDDIRDERVIEANLLTIRLTYFYELRIPFANWQVHSFYMGREFLEQLRGLQFEQQRVQGQSATRFLVEKGRSRDEDHRRVADLAQMSGGKSRYVIPLVATWSMRMQSNLFNNGRRGPASCAVDR